MNFRLSFLRSTVSPVQIQLTRNTVVIVGKLSVSPFPHLQAFVAVFLSDLVGLSFAGCKLLAHPMGPRGKKAKGDPDKVENPFVAAAAKRRKKASS